MRDLRAKDSGRYNVRGLCVLFGKSKQAYYQYDEDLALGKVFHSLEEVIAATALAADFYNNRRPHMSIGMMTPAEASDTSGDRDMRWKSYRMMAIKSRNSLDIAEIPLPCPSVMGLLQTSGLQSTHDSDKSQAVNPRQY